jgi:hypothetical protein
MPTDSSLAKAYLSRDQALKIPRLSACQRGGRGSGSGLELSHQTASDLINAAIQDLTPRRFVWMPARCADEE